MKKVLTQREYARWRASRRLPGTSPAAVQRAIKSGRIDRALVEVDGQVRIDPAIADQEWSNTTRYRHDLHAAAPVAGGDDDTMSPLELRLFLDRWLITNLAIEVLGDASHPNAAADELADRLDAAAELGPVPEGVVTLRTFIRAHLSDAAEIIAERRTTEGKDTAP